MPLEVMLVNARLPTGVAPMIRGVRQAQRWPVAGAFQQVCFEEAEQPSVDLGREGDGGSVGFGSVGRRREGGRSVGFGSVGLGSLALASILVARIHCTRAVMGYITETVRTRLPRRWRARLCGPGERGSGGGLQ